MTEHLDDNTIEALAHRRDELITNELRAHARDCHDCLQRVASAQALSNVMQVSLRENVLPLGFDPRALARHVLAQGEAVAVSFTELVLAAAVALTFTLVVALVRGVELPTISSAENLFAAAVSLFHTADSGAKAIPGAWATITLLGGMLATLFALPTVALANTSGKSRRSSIASLTLLSAFAILPMPASAQDAGVAVVAPEAAKISLQFDNIPVGEALQKIADAGHVNLVARNLGDTKITAHLENVTVDRAFELVLIGTPLRFDKDGDVFSVHELPRPTTFVVDQGLVRSNPPPQPPSVHDAIAFGSNVEVGPSDTVKDAVAIGGNVTIYGHVTHDASAVGGNLVIKCGGHVEGNTVAVGGYVTREACNGAPATTTHDDNVHFVGVPFSSENSSKKASRHEHDSDDDKWQPLETLAHFSVLFLFGIVLLGITSTRLVAVRDAIRGGKARSFAIGILASFAAMFGCVALIVTLIGIPLALALIIGSVFAYYAGLVAVAWLIGESLPITALHNRPISTLAAGTAVLALISLVPHAGPGLVILLAIAGFGAVVSTRGGSRSI